MAAPILSDYFDARKEFGPIASGDSSLLLDLDFRLGETAIDAILVTTHGFTKAGSGGLWDTTLGYNPNGTRTYRHTNWLAGSSRAAAFANKQFTIYAEVRRQDLASTWLDDGTNFVQSGTGPSSAVWNGSVVTAANHPYGDYTGGTKQGFAFWVEGATVNTRVNCGYQVANSSGNPVGRFILEQHDGAPSPWNGRLQTDVVAHDDIDSDYASIMITADGREVRWYVDYVLVRRRYLSNDWWSTGMDWFDTVGVGNNGAAGSIFRGYIRRIQIANRCLAGAYTHLGTRVAFIGDSFVAGGSHFALSNSTTATVADIEDRQNGRESKYGTKMGLVDQQYNNPSIGGTSCIPWHRGLMQLSALDGLPFRYFCAGDSGHGWSSTVAAGAIQIRTNFITALNNYNPEILVALGSVNDVNASSPPTDLVAETKALLDNIIDGSSALRKILFFQTFPGHKGDNVGDAAWKAEYDRQIALQEQLDGYRDIVEFVPTYEQLGGDDYDAEFNNGGSQYAPLWDALYTKTQTQNEIHPYQYGSNRMAEIIWPSLSRVLLSRPLL